MHPASRFLLLALALLISVMPLVRCQSTEAGPGGTVVSIEPDTAYAEFGRLWVGMVGADTADTLVLFNDSLADTNALRRIPVPGLSEGMAALVIRGYESGSGKRVYEEVRVFDTRTSRLLSEPTRQAIRRPRLALRASDTLLSIGDTLSLVGTLGDTDGVIRSYAWDFRGDGRFGPSYAVDHPRDTLEAWSIYPDTGRFTVVLQALDDARKTFRASLPIQVVLDPPSADAGGDLEVAVGDTVRLRGTASDALGRVVRMEWSFGEADFIEVGDGDTAFAAPAEAGAYSARFRATDDDGLRAVDSLTVRVRYSGDASLADLRISSGMLAPAFDPGLFSFSATVPYAALSLGIRVARGESHAVVTVAGRDLAPSDSTVQVPLQVGGNAIPILVLAQDGRAQRRYDLFVTRTRNDDASLRSLAVNPGSLSPPFHRDSLTYRVTLEHGHEALTVLPIASDNVNARILVGETPVPSGTASPARAVRVGLDTMTILVLGHDEISSRTYRLRVMRLASADATLKSLDLSTGPLEPPFAAGIFQYADTVAHAVARVALKPVLSNPSAQVWVAGKAVASGAWSDSLPLAPGDNTLSAKVLAQNGDSAEYSVLLRRRSADARLASLTVSEGRLDPPFSAGNLAFRDTVENRVERFTVRAEAADAAARLVLHDGLPATGPAERVLPLVSGSNPFLILVQAEEGNVDTVRLTVFRKRSRDTSLSALEPSSGSLVPPFSAAVRSYQMTLPNATTSLAFRPTAAHPGSRIFVSGKEVASGALSAPSPLSEAGNAFLVSVVSESGDSGFYRVAVRRRSVNADLASLTVGEGGPCSPPSNRRALPMQIPYPPRRSPWW